MHILLVTDSYPPEIRSASHLMRELAEELNARGHRVTVLTSSPRYNLSAGSLGKTYAEHCLESNIEVIRVSTLPHHKVNFMLRGIAQLTMPMMFIAKVKKYLKGKIDAVLVYSPPLPLAEVGAHVKKKYGARYVLNIQDIFPQNAIDLGILRDRLIIKWFEWLECRAYGLADKVTAHSAGNRTYLLDNKKISEDKVAILHNWIDTAAYSTGQREGNWRREYGMNGKCIFLFAGVIGPSQGLDLLIAAAKRIRVKYRDVAFLIVGDGTEKCGLIRMAESMGLDNVVFKPFVSQAEYPKLVNECDVGIVSLSSKNKTPVVPGKLLGYMAASKPVVAFLNQESDGHQIIKDAHCGISTVSNSPDDVVLCIETILGRRENLKEFGRNGRKYVVEHFDKERCVDDLLALLDT